jgi:phage terminase small subunit
MPTLKNTKHERFAQELARGKSQAEAYKLAGYKPDSGAASRLSGNVSIQTRVAELQEKIVSRVVERAVVSKEWVIEKLVENAERSLQARRATGEDGEETGEFKYQGNVANRALELIGKELGMFVDRKEVGKPGEFADLSDDEIDAQIRELSEGEEAGVNAASQREKASAAKKRARPTRRLN